MHSQSVVKSQATTALPLHYPLNRMLGGPHAWYGLKLKYGSSVAEPMYTH